MLSIININKKYNKFNYIALNTDQLNKIEKFYIYISEKENWPLIKECNPPINIERSSG